MKRFVMSTYVSAESLYRDKAAYYEKKYNELRLVAVDVKKYLEKLDSFGEVSDSPEYQALCDALKEDAQ